jgi:uncharacterized protein YecE (DUF72 family)
VRAGTSGFAYRAWIPSFYPVGTKTKDLLAAYAARLPAVELNHTFYRLPTAATVAGWRAQVPATFRFAVKAPMWLTVARAAIDPVPAIAELRAALAPLGPTLGCLLLQYPPHAACDLPRLAALLQAMPAAWRCACEFAHPSWRQPAVDELLLARGGTRVRRDDDGDDDERDGQAVDYGWRYARLRREDYTAAALAQWRRWLLRAGAGDAFAFFRHEDTGRGPRLASALLAGAVRR